MRALLWGDELGGERGAASPALFATERERPALVGV
jgi:hypothetical protein